MIYIIQKTISHLRISNWVKGQQVRHVGHVIFLTFSRVRTHFNVSVNTHNQLCIFSIMYTV